MYTFLLFLVGLFVVVFGVGGEIQLTDAISKLDEIYGVAFEGKTYAIGNSLEWLKTSIEFTMDSEDGDELCKYLKTFID